MPTSKSRKRKPPKRVLALPDLEHAKTAVLNSLSSASGQRTYEHAIREFVAWYCSEPRLAFNRTVVLRPGRLVVSNTGTRLPEDAVGCRASRLITAAAGQGALRSVLSEWRLTLDAQAWA